MATFFFIMQHTPSQDQLQAARALATRIVALAPLKPEDQVEGVEYSGIVTVLNVPDDPALEHTWFLNRAEAIEAAVGGFHPDDVIQAMGQPQLANALNALVRARAARAVESVTARETVEEPLPDGSTKKTTVFRFKGFRNIYAF